MIIRTAFFQGRIRPGQERAFHDLLNTVLIPLWRRFPDAEEVRVLHRAAGDVHAPDIAMALSVRYPSLAAMHAALASDIREQTRAPSEELKAMFDGVVFHVTFEGDDHVAA
jgi:hypothetical protein